MKYIFTLIELNRYTRKMSETYLSDAEMSRHEAYAHADILRRIYHTDGVTSDILVKEGDTSAT